jgi:tetratricopeptide (TPR) repeat protein
LPVAAGVRELVARRLDRLGELGRRVMAAAAVIQREFEFALVPLVGGINEEQAAEGIEDVVRHRLLREVGSRFEIVHDRIRQIVYDDLLAPRRMLLHRRAAQAIEALYADDLAPHVTALALHYRAAESWREAAQYGERASLAAARLSAHQDAALSFAQALSAVARLPETPDTLAKASDLEFRLGYSLALSGRFEEALEHYGASARLAGTLADDRRRWFAESARASPFTSLGRYIEGLEIAEPSLVATEAIGDVRGQFWTRIQLARIQHALGHHRVALAHTRAASACLRDAPSIESVGPDYPPPLAWRAWAVMNHAMLGAFDAAGPEVEELEQVLGDPSAGRHARLVATASLGVFSSIRGEVARASSLLESAIALGRQSATTSMLPRIASCLAWAHVLAGRAGEAIALLEDIVERLRSLHHHYLFEEVQCRLGEAYLAAGRLADAERVLREALTRARETRARGAEAEILRLVGELEGLASAPDLEPAAAPYVAAIAIADDLGMRPLAARGRFGLAGLYRHRGRSREAAELLARAVAEFRDMGMSFWVSRVESDLTTPA